MQGYRPGGDGDGVVRVGECAGWAFALEYGDSTGGDLLAEISRDGVEAVRYVPIQEHPPATVDYARDGQVLCSFGLAEENQRYGKDPDLLIADLIAGQVLGPDGETLLAPRDPDGEYEDFRVTYRRTLGVVERHFGLSLPPACLKDGRLPAYAVRGTPQHEDLTAPARSQGRRLATTSAASPSAPAARLIPIHDVLNSPLGPGKWTTHRDRKHDTTAGSAHKTADQSAREDTDFGNLQCAPRVAGR
ncbi:hypothetical protein GCM10020254_00090 [Streptomyces goshikiensis]